MCTALILLFLVSHMACEQIDHPSVGSDSILLSIAFKVSVVYFVLNLGGLSVVFIPKSVMSSKIADYALTEGRSDLHIGVIICCIEGVSCVYEGKHGTRISVVDAV